MIEIKTSIRIIAAGMGCCTEPQHATRILEHMKEVFHIPRTQHASKWKEQILILGEDVQWLHLIPGGPIMHVVRHRSLNRETVTPALHQLKSATICTIAQIPDFAANNRRSLDLVTQTMEEAGQMELLILCHFARANYLVFALSSDQKKEIIGSEPMIREGEVITITAASAKRNLQTA